MSQKIQVRRGTDAVRQSVVFDQGEPLWTTDTKQFYVGDGSTSGGLSVGGLSDSSESYKIVLVTTNATTNANNLINAVNAAKTKTPYGLPLSSGNRYTVLVPPGIYDCPGATGVVLDNAFIDLVGLSDIAANQRIKGDCQVGGDSNAAILINLSGNNIIKNIWFENQFTGGSIIKSYGIFLNAGGGTVSNVELDNVAVTHTGSPPPATDFEAIGLNLRAKNLIINNFYTTMPLFSQNTTSVGISGGIISNSRILADHCFTSANASPNVENYISIYNSTIIGNSGFAFAASRKWNENIIIDKCFISGLDWFQGTTNPGRGYKGIISNSIIKSNIYNFDGKMMNCIIDSRDYTGSAINLSTSTTYPIYSNCTILGGGTHGVSVTGTTSTTSGIFVRCNFSHAISTGVTGLLSECQGNVISERFLKI